MAKYEGCLSFVLRIFGLTPSTASYSYSQKEFLSPAELSFFRVLNGELAGRAALMCKVRLSDIFSAGGRQNQGGFNRINQKHVDFLVCDPVTLKPVAGIELDDRSHETSSRRARDEIVDSVFHSAGLPILHIKAKSSYAPRELIGLLDQAIRGTPLPK